MQKWAKPGWDSRFVPSSLENLMTYSRDGRTSIMERDIDATTKVFTIGCFRVGVARSAKSRTMLPSWIPTINTKETTAALYETDLQNYNHSPNVYGHYAHRPPRKPV